MTAELTRLTPMKVMLEQNAVPLATLGPNSEYENFQICLCSSVQVMCLFYLSEFNKK
jgi:hypothetical protein